MTPEELDLRLRRLSEHERLYQQGAKPAPDPRPTIAVDGVPVVVSHFSSAYDPKKALVSAPSTYLRVNRHSRFREYPLHMHDFVELSYMYAGHCMEVINQGIYSLQAGQVLLVDSATIHTIAPLGLDDILVNVQISKSYFDNNFFNRLDSDSLLTSFFVNSITRGTAHDNFILFHAEDSRRLPLFMNELLCECYDPGPRSASMVDALLTLVLSELITVYENDMEVGRTPQRSPAVPVLRYIEQHYRDCSLAGCAREMALSTSYLTKMLKRETGRTFKELVHEQRIAVAKRLLAGSDLPVTEVAASVGYSNMSFFYKVFERACGTQPGEWRRAERASRQGSFRPS